MAYFSKLWGSYSGKDIIELPLYNPNETQNHFIYFNRGKITRNINPTPTYIDTKCNSTRNFHLNNLKNGFNVSAIISTGIMVIFKSKELEGNQG